MTTPRDASRDSPSPGVARRSSRPVERRAAMPAGFAAGGLAAGIKASGRPDLAVVVDDRRSGRRGRRLHPERVRGGARPAVAGAPRRDVRRPARRVRLGRGRHLDERLARTRRPGPPATPTRPRSAGCSARRTRRRPSSGRSTSRPGSSARGCRSTRSRRASRGARADARTDRRRASTAAAEALRTTDSVTKVATTTVELPDADGAAGARSRVSGIAKGVGMIHPRMATMLVGRADRRGRRARRRCGACSGRPPRGPGTSCRSTATRAPTTRSSSSPPGAAGRRRSRPAAHGGGDALGAAIEAVARDLARQQAADGEGATTLITCQVTGAARRRRGPGGRPRGRLVAAWSRRRPTAATRTGAGSPAPPGNARLADAAVLEAGRPARRRGGGACRHAGRARPGPAPDRDRRPPRVRRPRRRPGRLRSRRGARGDGRRPRSLIRARPRPRRRHRRGLRLRPDRALLQLLRHQDGRHRRSHSPRRRPYRGHGNRCPRARCADARAPPPRPERRPGPPGGGGRGRSCRRHGPWDSHPRAVGGRLGFRRRGQAPGPTEDYYAQLVAEQQQEAAKDRARRTGLDGSRPSAEADRFLGALPIEVPFDDAGGTSPLYNTSVITLVESGTFRALIHRRRRGPGDQPRMGLLELRRSSDPPAELRPGSTSRQPPQRVVRSARSSSRTQGPGEDSYRVRQRRHQCAETSVSAGRQCLPGPRLRRLRDRWRQQVPQRRRRVPQLASR